MNRPYPPFGKITQSPRIRLGTLSTRLPISLECHHLLFPSTARSNPPWSDDSHHRSLFHAILLWNILDEYPNPA
jgi:hypothetical protein